MIILDTICAYDHVWKFADGDAKAPQLPIVHRSFMRDIDAQHGSCFKHAEIPTKPPRMVFIFRTSKHFEEHDVADNDILQQAEAP
jgi:hypothetical protein